MNTDGNRSQLDCLSMIHLALTRAHRSSGSAPVGTVGVIARAVDQLRSESAPAHLIALAERILLALHMFEITLRSASDERAKISSRLQLSSLSHEWLYADRSRYSVQGSARSHRAMQC